MIRSRTEGHGGRVVKTEGDGAFLAFDSTSGAVATLLDLHDATEAAEGPEPRLRLRCGAHSGHAVPVAGDYIALAVNIAARVSSAARNGQVLVTSDALDGDRPAVETGTFLLKGIPEPVTLWRLAGDDLPPQATPYRRTNVADSRTSFIGRSQEPTRLRTTLADPGLVTLLGPGGVGKTRISHELALADRDTWPGGVWMAELAPVADDAGVHGAVGAALGLTDVTPVDVQAELVRRGRTLLVLDNCEHLLEPAAELVDTLLTECLELSVLATSREALSIVGEQVVRLSPLSTAESGELFRQRAEVAVDEGVLVEISELLDGLPLAVELAAPYAGRLAAEDLRSLVAESSGGLRRRSGPERQRDLEALVRWSLDRLDATDRAALLALSVFPGRFTGTMAQFVLDALEVGPASVVLADLVGKSLVDLDGDEYRMLVTIRAVTAALLSGQPALAVRAERGLIDWATAFGDDRFEIMTFHDEISADQALAALEALGRAEAIERTGTGTLWHFIAITSSLRIEIGIRAKVLAETFLARGGPDRNYDEAIQLAAASLICFQQFGGKLTPSWHERLDAVVAEFPQSRAAVEIHGVLGRHYFDLGDLDASEQQWREAAKIVEGDDRLTGLLPTVWDRLSFVEVKRGDMDAAIELTIRSIDADAAAGTPHLAINALLNLSTMLLDTGNPEGALTTAQQALGYAKSAKYRGYALGCISWASADLGRREDALLAAYQAIEALEPFAANPDVGEDVERTRRVIAELE